MTNQPTFADGPPVPMMVDGMMDAGTLQQLFSDLTTSATVLCVREKGGPTSYTSENDISLDAAAQRMLDGQVRAIQVRYLFSHHEWTDTIMALPAGFRVVRCQHETAN